jgi:hypothetical protein
VLILVRVGILSALENVLDRDQSPEHTLLVHHGKLLDPVLGQNPFRLVEPGANRCGDQLVLGHHLADRLIEIPLELEIAIGDDADQLPRGIHDRDAGNPEPVHQGGGFAQGTIGTQRDRVHDHPALAALHPIHLRGLAVDRHVLVKHADPAARAIAMAISASVTVSIAAETSGMLSAIFRVRRLATETCRG